MTAIIYRIGRWGMCCTMCAFGSRIPCLTEALFENEPSAEKIDYYERVLFDHLLGTHDPILGRTVYHTPMRHATTRTYSSEFDSMWCCTGSGLETPAKYGQMVFTRASDDSFVRVNLFAPATLDRKDRGVKLRQATAFPYAETSCIQIESVGANPEFAVKVRRPAWAGNGFSVSVNGKSVETIADGEGYVSVKRSWKSGDRLAVGAAPGGRTLVARYRNCEKGARAFDVLVDGKKVFTESLKDSGRRGFIFREMPIPQELVAGKKEIEVRFEPKPGNIAGGLFGLWLVPSGIPIR